MTNGLEPPETGPIRILILNQSFWPDVVATAQHAHDLAKYLASRGAQVSVITSRSLYGQPGSTLRPNEVVDGVKVYRVSSNIFSKRGIATRSIDFLTFNIACLMKAVRLPKHDVVIALTTPPFVAIVGIILRMLKGSRFVFWTMDLYPDLPLEAGVLRRNSILYRIFDAIDRYCLKRADKIIVLGRCMRDRVLAKGIDPERIEMIHPWADPLEVPGRAVGNVDSIAASSGSHAPVQPGGKNAFRSDWGIGNRFVIQYSGNCGIGHDIETVCQAMLALREDDGIRWVFVGGGVMRPAIREFVDKHGISNVQFQPYQPRSRLGDLISLGDIHLVLMSKNFEGVILPSKFYGVLAASRPTLFVGPAKSEVGRVIGEEQCGFIIANGDSSGVVDAIRRIRADPIMAEKMGVSARRALEERYSMQIACDAWRKSLATLMHPTSTAPYSENRIATPPVDSVRALRILVISQYFPPDVTAAAYRIGDTVKLLKQFGHDVRVITATPHKGGIDQGGEYGIDADEVTRVAVRPLTGQGTGDYLSQYLRFAANALRCAVQIRRKFDYDVVWATSPPLFMAMCTIPLRMISRRPVVLDIRDLWPESAVGVGKIRRGSVMERLGRLLETAAYRLSDRITCVSIPMKAYILTKTAKPVAVVYNGAPESQLLRGPRPSANPDVFCYAGNLGYAQGLDGVLTAFAEALKSEAMSKAELHLVGTGAVEGSLQELAERLNLRSRIVFHGVRPKGEALTLMSGSGVLLIPLLDSLAFELTVPSKVFDCMGLGRPVIASVRGEGKEILESTGANIVVAPGDVPALVRAFQEMRANWHKYNEKAALNVELVASKFSREAAVRELERVLSAAVLKRSSARV